MAQTSSNVNQDVAFRQVSGAIKKMIVEIIVTNLSVAMLHVLQLNSLVQTDVAFPICGNAIRKMIVVMGKLVKFQFSRKITYSF